MKTYGMFAFLDKWHFRIISYNKENRHNNVIKEQEKTARQDFKEKL